MTVTVQEQRQGFSRIKWAWTSDASGDASEATPGKFTGLVFECVTIPDGVDAPTDNYDITITDDDGLDVLRGLGADRDTANTEYLHINQDGLGTVHNSILTLTVANAGNAKEGVVYLTIMV